MKKHITNRKRLQACCAHLVEVYNEEKDGDMVLTNKFNAHKNRKANTSGRRAKHKKRQALKRARIADEARGKNTYDAKSLSLTKLNLMDLNLLL